MILHLSLALLAALTFPQNGISAGNVGCLFSEELCKSESQWCFDDGAFGRCLDSLDNTPTDDLYRHSLDKVELAKLEMELEKLMESGYRWSHRHTQCVLQALLFSFQTGNDFEKIICDRLKDRDLESALRPSSVEDSDEQRNIAYINYQPSADNPRTDFADEVYYPPDSQSAKYFDRADEEDEQNEPYAVVRRSLPDHKWDHFSTLYNTPEHFRSGFELKDLPMSYELPDEKTEGMPYFPVPGPISFPGQDDYDENDEDVGEQNSADDDRDLLYIPKGGAFKDNDPSVTGYSEGGVVYFPQGKNDIGRMSKEDILESLGFKRRERLDVKKPGPPYDPAFQTTSSTGQPESITSDKEKTDEQLDSDSEIHLRPAKSMPWPKSKKPQEKVVDETEDSDEYDIVDTTYAYIKFKHDINNWRTASHIVSSVAELLNVPRKIFTQERPDRDEIIFKVNEPNALGLNASEVARRIDSIKEDLRRRHGVVVVSAGIGNKTKLPAMVRLDGRPEHEVYVVTVVVCGVLVALALSAGVLYLTRRHGHKIRNMTSSTEEPSKHYQELCRARMSGKTSPNQGQDTGGTAPAQRIASLSKESDKDSGSSRSSTSSWTEEPALTNMDVATGQMVLSYMEEHLKNKDRLDSEWAALCAYEADPSATTIAQRPENLQKNRYPHALPYDHARVVLNELSNITGSDYINASTITDHDPRNAAYIVTQGPLPHTAPDLWQMVWEQGCVVMVMLTRLGDGDTSLCHRYWPEEGSELYHIYEVHLVSEHIWCDDYLVRSFYLKNLKTGETRTVTQFHFLSWPEGGVPASTKPLLEFRRKVNKSFRGRSCPIVVHCSDGVGRSGAYCLLDMVLNRMAKGAKEIDIAATLEHVRDQRAGAVATKQQFQFVLSAVADEVQALLKVLPQQ